jgi:2-haloalkanoic acid dehalogenase type II
MGTVVIKAVIFDLYGTLMTSHEASESIEEALSKILREAGYEIYFQEVWAARQFVAFIDYTRGRANTPHEYYAKVLERLEIHPDSRLVDKFVNKDFEMQKNELYPDVAATVNKLKTRGIKTAILTTIATWRFMPLLEQNKIEIDFVCTAREAAAVKPNPRIYQIVLTRFGINAEEAMMVGDDIKTDILPAKSLGIKAVLLSRNIRTDRKDADHIVSSLTEITDLL